MATDGVNAVGEEGRYHPRAWKKPVSLLALASLPNLCANNESWLIRAYGLPLGKLKMSNKIWAIALAAAFAGLPLTAAAQQQSPERGEWALVSNIVFLGQSHEMNFSAKAASKAACVQMANEVPQMDSLQEMPIRLRWRCENNTASGEANVSGEYLSPSWIASAPAVDSGNAQNAANLAATAAYDRGDLVTAFQLSMALAEQGDAYEQFRVGAYYREGVGVVQDTAAAVSWYRLAANRGSPWAMYSLGVMYATGEGMVQDYVLSHMWYNLAASRFTAIETRQRAAAARNRDTVAAQMTPAQIARAQRLASEWRQAD